MSSALLEPDLKPEAATTGAEAKADKYAFEKEIFGPHTLVWSRANWWSIGFITVMHIGAIAALFCFSWQALAVAVGLYWLTGSIGVCLGYHRLLAHRSFKLKWPARAFTYLMGCLSIEGSPLMWTATHRVHHARSDQPGDPHSPFDGAWWAHMIWMVSQPLPAEREKLYRKYVPDLMNDSMLMFFERTFFWWTVALAGVLYAFGGWPMVLWGICARVVFVYHCTWFVNSATHLWGYRTYATKDDSRNLWWVALLSWGEGWHNNHHAYPTVARAGHRWWEIDMTFWMIRAMQLIGQATDVKDQVPTIAPASAPRH